jgi:hypothetical protein
MTAMMLSQEGLHNPVDLAELVVMDRDWSFDRLDESELVADTSGTWCNYHFWISWQEDQGALMLSCSFENKMPKQATSKVHALLTLVNEKLWVGHFAINSDDKSVMFRHSILIRDGAGTNAQQLQDLLDIAIAECERFYPAFQSVIWGGKSAAEALEGALFDTVGEA